MHAPLDPLDDDTPALRRFVGVFRYGRRAVELVWTTNWRLAVLLGGATLVAGLLPAAAAFAGKLIVDSVVAGMAAGHNPGEVLPLVGKEGAPVAVATGEGLLGLLRLQPEAKRPQSAEEFLRGYRDFIGSRLPS